MPATQGAGDEPGGAACACRARVRGATAGVARSCTSSQSGGTRPLLLCRALCAAGAGCQARVSLDDGQRQGGRGDLRSSGWVATVNRVSSGTDEAAIAPGSARSHGATPDVADSWGARCTDTTTDVAQYHRVELPTAQCSGTATLPLALGVCRWLHLAGCRSCLWRNWRRDGWHRLAHR